MNKVWLIRFLEFNTALCQSFFGSWSNFFLKISTHKARNHICTRLPLFCDSRMLSLGIYPGIFFNFVEAFMLIIINDDDVRYAKTLSFSGSSTVELRENYLIVILLPIVIFLVCQEFEI